MSNAAPSPLWTSAEISNATGGALSGAPFNAYGVSIDTRTLEPGDLFVALAGERDGHDFAEAALARGAAAALVQNDVGGPTVLVKDTLRALERLGEAARDRATLARRAAVTGSVGKTSVTQAIAAALKLAGPSHNSVLSYNNHIGVPLTLARMPRETERAVFEIGMNHAGEIGPLSKMVRPHVVVITLVGPVHVENFPDGEEGVAKAKAEIFEGMTPGGIAVLNADDRWFGLLSDAAKTAGVEVRTFGTSEGCDARLMAFEAATPSGPPGHLPHEGVEEIRCNVSTPPPSWGRSRGAGEGASVSVVVATLHGQALRFPIAQSGAHWGPNSLATLLAVEALGAPVEAAIEALATYAPLVGRGQESVVTLKGGVATLIDESYNANPISMRAALRTLAGHKAQGRRIVVMSDMLEMGADTDAVHAALVGPIGAANVDLVFAAGVAMHALYQHLPEAQRGGWSETAAELTPLVMDAVRAGDVVMVKGSKGSKASLVADALKALGSAPRQSGPEGSASREAR